MKKPVFKTAPLYAGLAAAFVLLDVAMNRWIGHTPGFDWPHFILSSLVALSAFVLVTGALKTRHRAEATLRQARDKLETRVQERTRELARANEALQVEIVERKQMEEALRESKRQLDTMFQTLVDGMVVVDLTGQIINANRAAGRILDIHQDAILGTYYNSLEWRQIDEHGQPYPLDQLPLAVALGERREVGPVEHPIIAPDGETKWLSVNAAPLLDENAQPYGAVASFRDITERKWAEAEIRHLSSFPQMNPDPVLEIDASGAITFCNPATTAILERLGVENDARAFLPSDLDAMLRELEHKRETDFYREIQVGGLIFGETIELVPAFNVVRIYARDITESKRAEEELRAQERLFHNLARVSPVGIFRTDADGDCVYVNERWIEMAGMATEQALGEGWVQAIHPEDRARVSTEWYRSAQDRRPFELEYRFQRPDGVVTWLLGQALAETDDTAQVVGYVGTITDITERKKSEEALRQAQSELEQRIQERTALEERQRLARELHDSVSQALYGISLGAHTALTLLDSDRDKVVGALDYVLSLTQVGLTEMRTLIFELRPESLEVEGLVAALNQQAAALRARHEFEVKLELCDEPDLPLETKEALYRIAQEALQNAVKHARPSRLDVRLVCDAHSTVLEVCDNGVGFDPTASFPGHLGLRSMRERATRLGGTLDIVCTPDGGTRIRACIPLSAAQAELEARDRQELI